MKTKKEKPLGQQLDEGFAILSGVLIRRIADAEYRMSAKIDALKEAKLQDAPKPFPFKIGKCHVLRSYGNKHTVVEGRIVDVDMRYNENKKCCVVILDGSSHRDQVIIFDEHGNCPYVGNLKLSQP